MADREQLLALYPSLQEQTLYILTGDTAKLNRRNAEMVAEMLEKAGYTEEDYRSDMELVDMRALTDSKTFLLSYTFKQAGAPVQWTIGTSIALCTLADRLSSTVYDQYLTADPKPDSVEPLPIHGSFTCAEVPFRVALDTVQEEGECLTLTFTVVPEDEWGLYPKQ